MNSKPWFAPILGVVLISITSATAQQATNNLPSTTVTVWPMAFYDPGEGQRPSGTCTATPITVGGLPSGQQRVGIFESVLEGTGHLWRATAWQASLTAAQLLDFDPRAMQVAISVEGRIDGPSAGALFTVGILAAVRGDTIKEDVTMTGTINPDGTIGPVGGIPYKMEGAKQAGKKVVLIPSTSRLAYDLFTEKFVDLKQHGETLGLEVHQVNDIWQAYEYFTGKKLPRFESAPIPEVTLAKSELLRKLTANWVNLQAKAEGIYESWSEDCKSEYTNDLMTSSKEQMKRCVSLTLEGEFAAAYWDAVMGTLDAWCAHEVSRGIYAANTSSDGYEAARRLLYDQAWVTSEVDKTSSAMRFFRPTNMDQVAIYMGACEAFYDGLCYRSLADKMRELRFEDDDLNSDAVLTAGEQLVVTWLDMMLARDQLLLADSYAGTPIPPEAQVMDIANFYQHCALAALAVVDEIEVKKVGVQYELTPDKARTELMLRDPNYAAAQLAANEVLPKLHTYFGEGPQYAYARLAATSALHCWSAMLIAKYYSLGIETDEYYNVIGIRNEKVLSDWLDDSRDQASRAINSLTQAKLDPTTCVQMYSIARINEGRGDLNRLDALEYYFSTNVSAQIMRRLAGVRGMK